VPKIVVIDKVLTNLLQKIKRCSFFASHGSTIFDLPVGIRADPDLLAFSRQNASVIKLLAGCRYFLPDPRFRQSIATFGHVILSDNFTSPIPYSLPHHAASGHL